LSQYFGLRRQSAAATALFRAGVILERREGEVIRDSSEAELSNSGVALRFPPHSKMSPTPGDLG
jgi:hypothetical protein